MKKNHSSEFKAKIVLEVLRGERALNEIASENEVHSNMLSRWKTDAVKNLYTVFENDKKVSNRILKEKEAEIDNLYKQIGKLTTQVEWLKKKSGLQVQS